MKKWNTLRHELLFKTYYITSATFLLRFLFFFLSHGPTLVFWEFVIVVVAMVGVWGATARAACVIWVSFLFFKNAANYTRFVTRQNQLTFRLALIHILIVDRVLCPTNRLFCFQLHEEYFLLFFFLAALCFLSNERGSTALTPFHFELPEFYLINS